ncbi:MAG TPA: DegT/DnrJ/EryC1/StrS family aminotransferase, partial [Gemmatimonadales bacterium]|nr:DegT/DnrJ/EryC1/StrS family aminotransferase [Gemmatimonadales bacterium]
MFTGAKAILLGTRFAGAHARLIARLRAQYRPRNILLTDSGTSALTAALIGALHVRPGARVALPAYSCYDVATAADGADARVHLYDIDPRTLSPDPASVRAALNRGAAVIVVAHLYGCPADVEEIKRLAAETGAVVIEDAAQAAGATVGGRAAGALGSVAVLSFGRGKGITGGRGGALLAYDAEGAEMLERTRGLLAEPRSGWSDLLALGAQLTFARPRAYALPTALPFLRLGETILREPRPLQAPTAVSCAVVDACWPLAEEEVVVRRRNAMRLLLELRRHRGFTTISAGNRARPGYLRLPVLAASTGRRLAGEMRARRLGVMPGYPTTLADLSRFGARCLNRDAEFPGSRELAERLCTFPTHSRL